MAIASNFLSLNLICSHSNKQFRRPIMSTLISEDMAFIQNDFKSWGFDAMYIRQLVEADHQQSQRLVSVAVQAPIKRIAVISKKICWAYRQSLIKWSTKDQARTKDSIVKVKKVRIRRFKIAR